MILTSNSQPTLQEGVFVSTNAQTTTDAVCAPLPFRILSAL